MLHLLPKDEGVNPTSHTIAPYTLTQNSTNINPIPKNPIEHARLPTARSPHCLGWKPEPYMSYSLNSLKGGYIGDYYRAYLRGILGV